MNLKQHAASISRFKKERYLRKLSEDDFRDQIVRPLLLRRGLRDGRDYCGPREAGKDAVFMADNALGLLDIYAVQTKKGHLNLGKQRSQNVIDAATQLKTALLTPVILLASKDKKYPNRALLCASGRINDAARTYICEDVKDPNLIFLDMEELIPLLDDLMPEVWCNIDADLFPYLRALKVSIERDTQLFTRGELVSANLPPVAASDTAFVGLRAFRYALKTKTSRGKTQQIPDIEEFPVTGLLGRKEPLVLLLGGAGSGKSTALLRMAYILCERAETADARVPTPVFLRAEEITEAQDQTLLDLCIGRCQEVAGTQKSPITSKDLQEGLLCVFIDGLDELGDLQIQAQVVQKAVSLTAMYPKCRVIIASRDYGYVEKIAEFQDFVRFNLTPINYKQAQKILERLHKNESLPVAESAEFLRRMQNVHGLELNPLIVTVFAASSDYSRRDIPANITELFKKFTEQMLGRWDTTKGLGLQYQAPLKDFILTRIAYTLHARKETSLSIHEFKHLLNQELASRGHKLDVDLLTNEILDRSGLFRIVKDRVEFRHLMLQEFFAGRGLPSQSLVTKLIADDWWRRALVFYFGERPNEPDLLSSLTRELDAASPPSLYQAAITLGLGLQASYLIEMTLKTPIATWVMQRLAMVFHDYETKVVASSRHPLHDFLKYYMFARDAVAFSLLGDHREDVKSALLASAEGDETAMNDLTRFWLIVGLIESGELDAAEEELNHFSPADRRLYLGIHLGAFLIQHLRVTTQGERASAKRICDVMARHLPDLRKQLLDEFKSEILEVQGGRIAALPPADAEEAEQDKSSVRGKPRR